MNNYTFKDLKIGQSESFTVTVTEEMMKQFNGKGKKKGKFPFVN